MQWGRAGLIAALGWPGQWAAEFARDGGELLRMRGGQELTHFTLHPGEEVRTPLVVLQFYDGDRVRAQNIWRRWMLAHNLPRTGETSLPQPMFTSCSGGFFPGLKCNEADELRFLDTFTQAGRQTGLLVDGCRLVSVRRVAAGGHVGGRYDAVSARPQGHQRPRACPAGRIDPVV